MSITDLDSSLHLTCFALLHFTPCFFVGERCPSTTESYFFTSPKDVWAVGYYGPEQYYSRLVEHWNGTTWSIVKSPYSSKELRGNYIESVASISTTNVWLVGTTVFSDLQSFAELWNGIKWSVVPVAHPGPGTTVDEMA